MSISRRMILTCLAFCTGSVCFASAIVNGGFETGDLTGWSRTYSGSGTVGCDNEFHAANTGLGCQSLPGPFDGSYSAYSSINVTGAGSSAGDYLTQTLVLPSTPVSSAILSWENVFAYSSGGSVDDVTLLVQLSSPLITNYVVNDPSGASPSPTWTPEQWNLTSYVNANLGSTVTLEFEISAAETSSATQTIAAGIDDVSFTSTSAVPEPSGLLFTAGGCFLLVAVNRLRRQRCV